MNQTNSFPPLPARLLTAIFLMSLLLGQLTPMSAKAEETNQVPPSPVANSDTNSAELLRSYLQLQEQLHGLKLSMEESRREADAAAVRNATAVAERLQALEQTLAAERSRDLEAVRTSNHVMLTVAITFAAVGVIAMLLMAYQWRTVSRLAEMSAQAAGAGSTTLPALPMLGGGDARLLGMGVAEQSNGKLMEALARLENRIVQMEQQAVLPLKAPSSENHKSQPALPFNSASTAVSDKDSTAPDGNGRVAMLLGKGHSLLNLDKAEESLTYFDEVLEIEPKNTEALLKKALALERVRKTSEALECYDRAISADASLTMAYLQKAGLYNRLERYAEALECYEQALKVQESR